MPLPRHNCPLAVQLPAERDKTNTNVIFYSCMYREKRRYAVVIQEIMFINKFLYIKEAVSPAGSSFLPLSPDVSLLILAEGRSSVFVYPELVCAKCSTALHAASPLMRVPFHREGTLGGTGVPGAPLLPSSLGRANRAGRCQGQILCSVAEPLPYMQEVPGSDPGTELRCWTHCCRSVLTLKV